MTPAGHLSGCADASEELRAVQDHLVVIRLAVSALEKDVDERGAVDAICMLLHQAEGAVAAVRHDLSRAESREAVQ